MARTKKTEAAVEAVKETIAAPAAEEVKAEAPKKAPAKKTAAKTTKTASKKAAAVVENVVIQQNGNEVTAADLIAKAKEDAGIQSPKKIDVYVRPEINMVYYVIDGEKFGSFELC
ncbi:MAG: hypothetical protein IJX77_04950 [Ruminococcus sp.]|nr:hypothetical protein [Ruminococcus sp.]